jgi:sulfite dehydrogenase
MIGRRDFIKASVWLGAGSAAGFSAAEPIKNVMLPFANGARPLVAYPGKRPLIRLTARPPQLETPFEIFDQGVLTPNDAFFVRYHLADIPLQIDPQSYRLSVGGAVANPLSLTLDQLKKDFEPVEIVAVNQCSGNSRGYVEPRVGGGQLAHGAMGNARWRGVSLKSVLDKAGVKAHALSVGFNGLDRPVLPETPDFMKSLEVDHARDGEVMLAYAMNGSDLPMLNGFPLRLIVPGYYGTYWVKHLSDITVLEKPLDSYWMNVAYRIPENACACTPVGKLADATTPISRLTIRSFITNVVDGQRVAASKTFALRGIAFDGGAGVDKVEVSTDEGSSWRAAQLGDDLGKYSFREWRLSTPLSTGAHVLMARATNAQGQTQPLDPLWNPSGYGRNVVERLRVQAS